MWRAQDYFLVLPYLLSQCRARAEKEKCLAIKISTVLCCRRSPYHILSGTLKAHHKLSSANKHKIKAIPTSEWAPADPFIIGASRRWLVNKNRNWLIIIRGMERMRLRRTQRMINFIVQCTLKMSKKTHRKWNEYNLNRSQFFTRRMRDDEIDIDTLHGTPTENRKNIKRM